MLAIVITLLVLNIHVPSPEPGMSLARQLGHEWPTFAAYVVSFLTIGIIWINHHAMIRRLQAVDHAILTLNLGLLLTIGILPFTTALMAAYLNEPHGQHLAAALYSGSFLLMAIAFTAIQRHILFAKAHLLQDGITERARRTIFSRGLVGNGPYIGATVLAPISAYATLAVCGAVAAVYALPRTTADNADA